MTRLYPIYAAVAMVAAFLAGARYTRMVYDVGLYPPQWADVVNTVVVAVAWQAVAVWAANKHNDKGDDNETQDD